MPAATVPAGGLQSTRDRILTACRGAHSASCNPTGNLSRPQGPSISSLLTMRQRITFLQEPQDSVDPKALKVTRSSISAPEIKAAREERVTFAFEELPQELYRSLKGSHELHIRWASPNYYSTIAPLISTLSPGLHVFYTPQLNRAGS
jgi:hypothetical protein